MINRRGQIPILMLFAVTIILVIVALMSFATFDRAFNDNPLSVSKAIAKVNFAGEYIESSAKLIANEVIKNRSSDLSVKFKEIASLRDLQVQESGNFFGKIRNGEFNFENVGDEYKLNVNGLFVQASYGDNQITRKFDLCMLFDSSGSYIERGLNDSTEKDYADKCGQKGL